MNKVLAIVAIGVLISLAGLSFFSTKQTVPQLPASKNSTPAEFTESSATPMTDIRASFAIFTNGTFRIFTAAMYHNLSQDVYIEANNPNRVQVKKSGITWNDFFLTLPFKVTSECLTTGTKEIFCSGSKGTLQFYINGVKSSTALDQEIKDGDKLLVTYGTESEIKIKQQIDKVP